ncbi:hypothetical protein GGI23_000442 [Coemansia sp. RSA 2559]|nr:hypothetical protein GGI23_000442 [Coemansia sp. RSA 2559]KAJ2869215.1 hypothetical protein GGI22_000388 [Coemansia erecta]
MPPRVPKRTPFNSIQKRIVGGTAVSNNEYPFAVHLVTTYGTEQFLCGGAIIDNSYIVTAAHCLMNENTNAVAEAGQVSVCYGSSNLNNQKCTTAREVTIHPEFNLQKLVNDIAIIQISSLSFSSSVASIPIYTGKLPENTELVTMGWGMTNSSDQNSLPNALLSTDIKIGSPEVCSQAESSYSSADGPDVCTSNNLTPGQDSCQGDSGSPTVISSGGKNYLVAVTSSGVNVDNPGSSECAAKDGLAFYTHVYYFVAFISKTTGLSTEDLSSGLSASVSSDGSTTTSAATSAYQPPLSLPASALLLLLSFIL